MYRVREKPRVVDDTKKQRDAESGMKQSRVCRWLLLENLDPSLAYPFPYLARHQGREHDEEPCSDLLPEDRHGQACFRHGKPCLFVELLDFDGSEPAITQPLEAIDKCTIYEEDEIDEDLSQKASVGQSSPSGKHVEG